MSYDKCSSKSLLICHQNIKLGLDPVSNFTDKDPVVFFICFTINILFCLGLKTIINSWLHKVYLSNKICDHISSKITNVFYIFLFSFDLDGKLFEREIISYNLYYNLRKHNRLIHQL